MRVLFITGEFPPMQGGVGDCTNEIARGLVALNADVQVLTSAQASVGNSETVTESLRRVAEGEELARLLAEGRGAFPNWADPYHEA